MRFRFTVNWFGVTPLMSKPNLAAMPWRKLPSETSKSKRAVHNFEDVVTHDWLTPTLFSKTSSGDGMV